MKDRELLVVEKVNKKYKDFPLKDISFTLNDIVAIPQSGDTVYTGVRGLYSKVRPDLSTAATAAVGGVLL